MPLIVQISIAGLATVFAFDLAMKTYLMWQDRRLEDEYRHTIETQHEHIQVLAQQNADLEEEIPQSFRSGLSTGKVIYGGDTQEFEPIRPRGVMSHLRAVDDPTAELFSIERFAAPDSPDAA